MSTAPPSQKARVSVPQVLASLIRHPVQNLLRKWNWKSAILSSFLRASMFFLTNLSAGLPAAIAAMNTELVFRGITSGFYGTITESLRKAEPAWSAAVTAMILLPIANHSVEFVVHWLRGTHNLLSSIVASVALTVVSTLFNLFAMRRGALIVGEERRSLLDDLRRLPMLLLEFALILPRRALRHSLTCVGWIPPDEH